MAWRWIVLVPLVLVACGGDDGTAATTVTVASVPPAVAPEVAATVPPSAPTSAPPVGVVPQGFATEAATITAADGTVCEVCLWKAAAAEERAQGLMGVTDLGGADGMVFVFDAPTTSAFWMRDTPTPLSIAFFAADGAFVSEADMAPCVDGPDEDCPRYHAAGPYAAAIEVFAGDLAGIGALAGSRLALLGTPCDPI